MLPLLWSGWDSGAARRTGRRPLAPKYITGTVRIPILAPGPTGTGTITEDDAWLLLGPEFT